jgi:competence protein ComEA
MHRQVDLNTAGKEELMQLPNISEGSAQEIVEYRAGGGQFECVEDLAAVAGLRDTTIQQVRDHVKVGRGSVASWHRHWLNRSSV